MWPTRCISRRSPRRAWDARQRWMRKDGWRVRERTDTRKSEDEYDCPRIARIFTNEERGMNAETSRRRRKKRREEFHRIVSWRLLVSRFPRHFFTRRPSLFFIRENSCDSWTGFFPDEACCLHTRVLRHDSLAIADAPQSIDRREIILER